MNRKLTRDTIARIKRLRKVGFTQEQVAEKTALCVVTIRKVDGGWLPKSLRPDPVIRLGELPEPNRSKPPRKCPGCRHWVYMPCVLCAMRRNWAPEAFGVHVMRAMREGREAVAA